MSTAGMHRNCIVLICWLTEMYPLRCAKLKATENTFKELLIDIMEGEMASKMIKWKIMVDEGVYTQYQLAVRYARNNRFFSR